MKTTTFFFIFNFLCTLCGMWDLSSQTRDGTHTPSIGGMGSTTGLPGKSLKTTFYEKHVEHVMLSSKTEWPF